MLLLSFIFIFLPFASTGETCIVSRHICITLACHVAQLFSPIPHYSTLFSNATLPNTHVQMSHHPTLTFTCYTAQQSAHRLGRTKQLGQLDICCRRRCRPATRPLLLCCQAEQNVCARVATFVPCLLFACTSYPCYLHLVLACILITLHIQMGTDFRKREENVIRSRVLIELNGPRTRVIVQCIDVNHLKIYP